MALVGEWLPPELTPYQEFKLKLKDLCVLADARAAEKKRQALAAIRPAPQPALMTADALQEKVLRPHQLEAIEQLGHALHSLVPLIATIDTQLTLHSIKATNMTLAQIAAGRLYHEIAEAVVVSRWASNRLQAGAVQPVPVAAPVVASQEQQAA